MIVKILMKQLHILMKNMSLLLLLLRIRTNGGQKLSTSCVNYMKKLREALTSNIN